MTSASRSSVAISASASQLIKLIKSVTSLVLKKEKESHCEKRRLRKVTTIVCVFLRKAPTKKNEKSLQ